MNEMGIENNVLATQSKIVLVANTDWYIYNFRNKLILDFIERGHEVVVVAPPGEFVPKIIALGCQFVPWTLGRQSISPLKELGSIRALVKIYRDLKPTVVHHHTLKAVIYGTIAAKKMGVPVVNSIPGMGFIYSSHSMKAQAMRPIVDLLLKLSLQNSHSQIIFENRVDMQYFISNGLIANENVHLIKSVGVNVEYFSPKEVPPFKPFMVGFVGRMLWDKGAGVFAKAAEIVHKSNPQVEMVLIGMPDVGNPRSIPEQKIKEWEQKGVLAWWGWQSNMPEVYGKLHALAYPTNYGEGVPTVLLEAGATKRALIASDSPGCREVIEDGINGYLVDANDPQELADKILHLASSENEYNTLRENGYLNIVENFTTRTINSQTILVYAKLLGVETS